MTVVTAKRPSQAPASVADVMTSATRTVTGATTPPQPGLMHQARTTSLVVPAYLADKPVGVITAADIARAVADGSDLNEIHIHDLLTARPAAIPAATPVRDAAEVGATESQVSKCGR
jgi:CBS domain-containing protein